MSVSFSEVFVARSLCEVKVSGFRFCASCAIFWIASSAMVILGYLNDVPWFLTVFAVGITAMGTLFMRRVCYARK